MESPAVRFRFSESRFWGLWASRGGIQKTKIAVPEGVDHFARSGMERVQWMYQNDMYYLSKIKSGGFYEEHIILLFHSMSASVYCKSAG